MHPKDILFHHANYFDIWKKSVSELDQPVHFVILENTNSQNVRSEETQNVF